ncbi:hypothetical protein C8J56DRAFT_269123 [Mycena floridula]|nr:hypothetical protein C8J56DRAFT_1064631 [Mycena floridula]KAJ7580655.1 hypothetical protein C8J56DRAFT_269123 [Mycena floridula]
MSSANNSSFSRAPEEHLGASWEIAVVVVVVFIFVALITTTAFHVRRKRRRLAMDLEDQRTAAESQDRGRQEKMESNFDSRLTKPPAAASSKRSSRTSFIDHPSQKPPKYYWDKR